MFHIVKYIGESMKLPDQPFNPKVHYAVQDQPPPVDASHIKRKFLDIAYAPISRAQRLDIYLPEEGKGPFPVIVAIHGGAFMGCDKGDLQVTPMLEGLKRGFAVVSINYRMSGEAKFPALVQDAKAAVRWIRANGEKYDFDSERIIAWGGSAGGYLSSMLAVSADEKSFEDPALGNADFSSRVQAAVIWYGPANFLKMDAHLAASGLLGPEEFRHSTANSPESLLLGDLITRIPDRVKAANPETYIGKNIPPMLLQHGRKDPVVPVQQSIEFYEKLKKCCGDDRVILEVFEGAEHADPAFETPENVDRVFRFLKANKIY
jgi:acetyl esterase/lipase